MGWDYKECNSISHCFSAFLREGREAIPLKLTQWEDGTDNSSVEIIAVVQIHHQEHSGMACPNTL